MIYETEKDRDKEKEFKEILEERFPEYRLSIAPKLHPYDFKLYKGTELKAIVEFKRRNIKHDAFDTFIIERLKINVCSAEADKLGVSFLLFLQYNDLLRLWKYDKDHLIESTVERHDRGISRKGYEIDIKHLKTIETLADYHINKFIDTYERADNNDGA